LLLAGCRQVLGLEPPVVGNPTPDASDVDDAAAGPDTPSCGTHDFDTDTLMDDCDDCPYVASANADADGDGVGDACDQGPMSADQRTLWLAFYDPADITGWTPSGGTWNVSSDLLHQTDQATVRLGSPMTFTTDLYLAASILTQATTTDVGICAADMPPSQYYCCTVSTASTPNVRATSAFGGGNPMTSTGMLPGGVGAGQYIQISATLVGSQFKCRFTSDAGAVSIGTPAGAKTGPVSFFASAPVDYRYLFVATVGP
jgi:hypothetical protein